MNHENHVILSQNFSVNKINELIKENKSVEFWMNMFIVDPYFNNGDESEKAAIFTNSLGEIWQIKLQRDFPNKTFTFEYFNDDEHGEYGLTFYQT